MRPTLAITVATLAFAVLADVAPTAAVTNADLDCQKAIGAAAREYVSARHEALVECANTEAGGGSCDTVRRDARIARALAALTRRVGAACRDADLAALGFPGSCPDPTGSGFALDDLMSCLEGTHRAAIDHVFVPVEYPGGDSTFVRRDLRCQRTIGRGGRAFVAARLRARARCLDAQLRGDIPATVQCRAPVGAGGGRTGDRRTDARLRAAIDELRSRLGRACEDVALADLGFPGLCIHDGGAFDVDDLRACVEGALVLSADDLTRVQYPTVPDPVPTATALPTPTPLVTPKPPPTGACGYTTVRFAPSGVGSDLDLGWTGLLHDQRLPTDGLLTFDVTGCDADVSPCGVCRFDGPVANRDAGAGEVANRRCVGDTAITCASNEDCGSAAPCAFFLGGPVPTSGGGIGVCVSPQVNGLASGSLDTATGAARVALDLLARVTMGAPERPCPTCVGDALANDGQRGGICQGGLHAGDPCDASGVSPFVAFGATSLDCPQHPLSVVATMPLPLALTTGTAAATLTEQSPGCYGRVGAKCFCPFAGTQPTQPNACYDDEYTIPDESLCDPSGVCPMSFREEVCAIETFRGCLSDFDCPAPGDSCVARNRPCFPDNGIVGGNVVVQGTPDPPVGDTASPTLVALFCVPPANSAAINAAGGLPGLGRLTLPSTLTLTRDPRFGCGDGIVGPSEACDPPGTDTCGGAVTCQPDCSCDLPVCGGAPRSVTLRSLAGGDLDLGWTGIAHDATPSTDARLPMTLECTGDDCAIMAGPPVGTPFLPPLPLSAGGVSSCVVNELREETVGTYDCGTGCTEAKLKLLSLVYLTIDQDEPCPPCVGDPIANDGVKDGLCDGGATPGAACDVGGTSERFQDSGGAPPDAGRTSNDCLPSGNSVGELAIDLNPLTTGAVSVRASVDCVSSFFADGSCFCPGQVQANACVPDGVCPASGVCEENPPDAVCSGQTYRQCDPTAGNRDCGDTFPGAGDCVLQPRPCFGSTIDRTGACGTESATLISVFCVPATRAAAINTVAGLPGPAAVSLPVASDGCRCAATEP